MFRNETNTWKKVHCAILSLDLNQRILELNFDLETLDMTARVRCAAKKSTLNHACSRFSGHDDEGYPFSKELYHLV